MYSTMVVSDIRRLDSGSSPRVISLASARKGDRGVVVGVGVAAPDATSRQTAAIDAGELEQRLLEIGFVEGARLTVLHEGLFGRDPIAVGLDDARIALRRREAAEVTLQLDEDVSPRK